MRQPNNISYRKLNEATRRKHRLKLEKALKAFKH